MENAVLSTPKILKPTEKKSRSKERVSLHRDTARCRFVPDPVRRLRLGERDLQLLTFLYDNHLASRSQLQQLFYGSKAYCNFRLRALFDHQIVARHFPSITLSGNWAEEAIYTLGAQAVPFMAEHLEEETETLAAYVRRHRSPSLVSHSLHVVEIYLAFRRALEANDGACLERWLGETSTHHPYQRRVKDGWESELFKPDGFLRLQTHAPARCHFPFFIECDLGNTSNHAWKIKVETHKKYLENGLFSSTYGGERFETLVVTTGEKRLEHLAQATGEIGGGFFRFTTWMQFRANPLGAIWCFPTDAKAQALLPV